MTQYTREDVAKAVADERDRCMKICLLLRADGGSSPADHALTKAAQSIKSGDCLPEAPPQAPTEAEISASARYAGSMVRKVMDAYRAAGLHPKTIYLEWTTMEDGSRVISGVTVDAET